MVGGWLAGTGGACAFTPIVTGPLLVLLLSGLSVVELFVELVVIWRGFLRDRVDRE